MVQARSLDSQTPADLTIGAGYNNSVPHCFRVWHAGLGYGLPGVSAISLVEATELNGVPFVPAVPIAGPVASMRRGLRVVSTLVAIAIIIFAGRVFFGIGWPAHWGELIVFVACGVVCFAALGVAFAHVIPNFESTAAYVNAVFLPVIFVSGVFYDVKNVPSFLRTVAEALPLKPLIDGLSGSMVTGVGLSDNLDALGVVGLWGALGLYFAVRGFSWEQSRK